MVWVSSQKTQIGTKRRNDLDVFVDTNETSWGSSQGQLKQVGSLGPCPTGVYLLGHWQCEESDR